MSLYSPGWSTNCFRLLLMKLLSSILILLLTIPTLLHADTMCALLYSEPPTVGKREFEARLTKEQQAEWAEVSNFLTKEQIDYKIERLESSHRIVFSIEGHHPLNQTAKKLLDKYGAKLSYDVGSQNPEFSRDFGPTGAVKNMYVMLPADYVMLPMSVARTYGLLHEVRHLVGFIEAYLGVESPYYGYFNTTNNSTLPYRSNLIRPSLMQRFVELFSTKSKDKTKKHYLDVYRSGVSVDEIRTFFSTVYQQALRISTRLKEGDMPAVELKERMEQFVLDVEILNHLSSKIEYNLEVMLEALPSSLALSLKTSYNDKTLLTGVVEFQNQGVPILYEVQLPNFQSPSLSALHRAIREQARWSLHSAQQITEATRGLIRPEGTTFTATTAREYVDLVLSQLNPKNRREFERRIENQP